MGQIYKKIENYVDRLGTPEGIILEIGSERGEGSTVYLDELAKRLGIHFVTCDIDKERVEKINQQGINAVCQRGEEYIPTIMENTLNICYLDNFDWNWWVGREDSDKVWVQHQIDWYKENHNIVMDNVNCQITHLVQSVLIETKTTKNSIICFDDTWSEIYYKTYIGKGGAAVTYLLAKGYEVLHTDGFGTILGRFNHG